MLRYIEQAKQVAEKTLITNRGAVRARLIPFSARTPRSQRSPPTGSTLTVPTR